MLTERERPTTVPDVAASIPAAPPPGVVLENVACPLECPTDDAVVLTGWDRLHGVPGRFQVVRCRHCGTMRTTPRPTPETIGAYYPSDYAPYKPAGDVRRPGGLKRLVHGLVDFKAEAVPDLPPGRMLEIGCAAGGFMRKMAERGWQVEGIEFSDEAASAARGLGFKVQTGTLEEAHGPAEPVDLVVGWMVMEHLHDPVGVLAKLLTWVKPGGWIAVSVPNAGSLEFKLFGTSWYALQLPTHLYHYTPKSLRLIFEKAGWRFEKLMHQRILTNALVSAGYALADRDPDSQLARKLKSTPERGFGFHLGLYPLATALAALGHTGRMTAWARRPL